MKAFHCDVCGSLVFFENVQCIKCNHLLGFAPDVLDLIALEPGSDNRRLKSIAAAAVGREYKLCENASVHEVCNWLVPIEDSASFCVACSLNEVIPDLQFPANKILWRRIELAKRRMLYTLLKLGLRFEGNTLQGRPPLRFRFLGDSSHGPPIVTGHDNGIITINVAEADDREREQRRVQLGEPFRTLLGHMRHEVAHFYWDELIKKTECLQQFRELFGDETGDYSQALRFYYEQGPAADWQSRFVSAYASAHPWEDWAETAAHYFHIVDMIETAGSFGISLRPRHPDAKAMTADPRNVESVQTEFSNILEHWLPLTYAMNELNRGMGLADLYPFVLSVAAIEKLRFVHDLMRSPAK
jgi:hypothetical protein